MRFRRFAPAALALALPLLLAGCGTFGLGAAPPPPAARAIDYRTDDLATLVLALDLPAGVQPVVKGATATFDVVAPSRLNRHLKAGLVLADGGDIDGQLPPPAAGHTYYLLGFADRDRPALAAAQTWLATLPQGTTATLGIAPQLCETAAVDPSVAGFAVIPVAAGQPPLAPIVGPAPLLTLPGGGQLPPCSSI